MPRLILLLVALAVLGSAQANDVFVTRNAQGRTVYTDRPESLPAQKVNVRDRQHRHGRRAAPDAENAQATSAADKSKAAAASQAEAEGRELTAADKAKRCVEARAHYEQVMTAQRLLRARPRTRASAATSTRRRSIGPRASNAKKVMDEFCADQ